MERTRNTQGTDVSAAAALWRYSGWRLQVDVHRLGERDTGATAARGAHPPDSSRGRRRGQVGLKNRGVKHSQTAPFGLTA